MYINMIDKTKAPAKNLDDSIFQTIIPEFINTQFITSILMIQNMFIHIYLKMIQERQQKISITRFS